MLVSFPMMVVVQLLAKIRQVRFSKSKAPRGQGLPFQKRSNCHSIVCLLAKRWHVCFNAIYEPSHALALKFLFSSTTKRLTALHCDDQLSQSRGPVRTADSTEDFSSKNFRFTMTKAHIQYVVLSPDPKLSFESTTPDWLVGVLRLNLQDAVRRRRWE